MTLVMKEAKISILFPLLARAYSTKAIMWLSFTPWCC